VKLFAMINDSFCFNLITAWAENIKDFWLISETQFYYFIEVCNNQKIKQRTL